ncbi:MAG: transcriptional regulator FtrA [Rhodospirillales bacterium]|nr:transcriptional regulator FtrA [Rhodospirillales bacterium]
MKIMPKPGPLRNRDVAVLAYDGLCTFEFGIAVELFGLPRPELADWYRCQICAAEPGPLRAIGGFTVAAAGGLAELETAGTILVPGWRDVAEPPPAALVDSLRRAYANGARLISICSGVFVLAATGLLAGKRATTHWRHVERLAAAYPDIRVEPDVLYVDEGQMLTSAGSAAGLDLGLHLIRRDFGPAIANQVARRLVIPPHRDGGQAQFIDRPVQAEGAALAALFDWIRANLTEDLSIARLARRAGLSERTFLRRFGAATGTTPNDWITTARLARARELLEGTDLAVERVATDSGFGTADTLRHHFRTRLQTSPQRYRDHFVIG